MQNVEGNANESKSISETWLFEQVYDPRQNLKSQCLQVSNDFKVNLGLKSYKPHPYSIFNITTVARYVPLTPTIQMKWPPHHENIWLEEWVMRRCRHGKIWAGWCQMADESILAEGWGGRRDLPRVHKTLRRWLDSFVI